MIQPARFTKPGWIILALVFFVYLFLVFDAAFPGPDEPIYYSYTASVVEDGDLNAVNHPDPRYPFTLASGKLGLSSTYNLPDFHAHGGVLLWAPLYLYAKIIYASAQKLNFNPAGYSFDRLARCAMSFSTALFAFLAVILTYKLARLFFSRPAAAISCLAIFFGTPFFYFTAQEPGNANILAALFSVISILFCLQVIGKEKKYWFLYGLFFSSCLAVKVDLWFQLAFLFILFLALLKGKMATWLHGASFILGLAPLALLKAGNDYIKYGTFHLGETGAFTFKSNYLGELLFSSYHGFFYTSPVFYICFLGFALAAAHAWRNRKFTAESARQDLFLVILFAYLLIKVLAFSYNYAWGGGTCGARVLLSEFPVFVLLFARACRVHKKFLPLLAVLTVVFISWNLLVIAEFAAELDLGYVARPAGLAWRIQAVKDMAGVLIFKIRDAGIKLNLLPLLVFSAAAAGLPRKSKVTAQGCRQGSFNRALVFFTVYLCLGYLALTVSNIYNNPRKVKRLISQGFFDNVEILGPGQFEKKENTGSLDEMIEYFTLKGDTQRVARIRQQKEMAYPDI